MTFLTNKWWQGLRKNNPFLYKSRMSGSQVKRKKKKLKKTPTKNQKPHQNLWTTCLSKLGKPGIWNSKFKRWNNSQNREILWDFFQFQNSALPFGKYRSYFKVQRYILVKQIWTIFVPITVKLLDENMLPLTSTA